MKKKDGFKLGRTIGILHEHLCKKNDSGKDVEESAAFSWNSICSAILAVD